MRDSEREREREKAREKERERKREIRNDHVNIKKGICNENEMKCTL